MKEQDAQPTEIQKLLNDANFQKKLARIATEKGDTLEKASREAEKYLTELYTEHTPTTNLIFTEATQYLLARGYDRTIDVNPEQIKALTKLMRRHPIAFVLTHKAYFDTLALSLVLARHGLPIPFTFGGINLDLFAVGKLARQNGVIFIRRSFKDNPIYKATLRYFIAYLVKKQANFMWALEGTRSRTGKLVWPQMGILKYILEGEHDAKTPVKYVPVSIAYDLIPDVEEMTEEGRGKKKNPEDLKWLLNYWKKLGEEKFGRISLRIGEPVSLGEVDESKLPDDLAENTEGGVSGANSVSRLAFDLVHRINAITPVTTTSLICTALLSKFALTKRGIESDVADLMQLIESHTPDVLVDRGKPIGESVQVALNLLVKSGIFLQQGDGLNAKYIVRRESYLQATYYSNMAVQHLQHRAFIELALAKIKDVKAPQRSIAFWTEIMALRDLFKFEFFYSKKADFSGEIEADLAFIEPKWNEHIFKKNSNIKSILAKQNLLVTSVLLFNYVEAYLVIAQGLQTWNAEEELTEKKFVEFCMFLGEEMHWQGQIRRIEAVSKPFLQNGIRLVQHLGLMPTPEDKKTEKIAAFVTQLKDVAERINFLQEITLSKPVELLPSVPIERDIVPGSKTEAITEEILRGERGSHIGAFFDLDRTLIEGFSAKDFFKGRVLSGKVTSKELVSQFAALLSYATGGGNFASMAAVSAKGVKGIPEQVFIDLGEEIYDKKLAHAIFPESRALVAAHLAMGHSVAIISAATPYQVDPIARDLGIPEVLCTRLEVENGTFTGNVIEPTCWGEGKAIAGRTMADKYGLDMQKSYFYTDSAEDLPLLEIVGNPRPINADAKLSALAFQNDWPIYRFTEPKDSKVENLIRTSLTAGSFIPAVASGVLRGMQNLSWDEGVDAMMSSFGDIGTAFAGIKLAIKNEENLWKQRPAVFILNHQSSADMLIAAKLIRKQARGVAKKELQKTPILGQIMSAAGTIFLDRTDKEKSIEALKPAVESLKSGISVIIFPEGTRSFDYTLGSFKKGAFHLAMQAGVPIVPIVLKNAHDAMPRGTNLFRPTMVEVVILPPVPTTDWTLENMNEKVAAVRGLFLEELGQLE
jgi:putative phosphoserine phosphatase / 1-acylglycerol-3-phosphate O-acyltransferase